MTTFSRVCAVSTAPVPGVDHQAPEAVDVATKSAWPGAESPGEPGGVADDAFRFLRSIERHQDLFEHTSSMATMALLRYRRL